MTADSDPAYVRTQLWNLYERWFADLGSDDASFFENTLSDEWVYIDYYGIVRGKNDYLDYIAPVSSDAPLNRMHELDVRLFGDVAVVHGRYVVDDEYAPPSGGDTRFTAVWAYRDGRWRAEAHHSTTVVKRDS